MKLLYSPPNRRPLTLQESHCRSQVLCFADVDTQACFRLRYHYFVEKRAWVTANSGQPGVECDNYDESALHIGIWDKGGVSAYLRVLPFSPELGFMLDSELSCVLSEETRQALVRENAVELSRLVVSPDAQRLRVNSPHPVELLLKRLYQESKVRGYGRFYIVVEESWLRPFARRFGLPFQVLGAPYIFPDGTKTVAATATLEELEAGMRCHSAAKYAWYQEEE